MALPTTNLPTLRRFRKSKYRTRCHADEVERRACHCRCHRRNRTHVQTHDAVALWVCAFQKRPARACWLRRHVFLKGFCRRPSVAISVAPAAWRPERYPMKNRTHVSNRIFRFGRRVRRTPTANRVAKCVVVIVVKYTDLYRRRSTPHGTHAHPCTGWHIAAGGEERIKW